MSLKFTVRTDMIDLAEELLEEFRPVAKAAVAEGADMLAAKISENASRFTGGASRPERFPVRRSGDLAESFKRGRTRLGRDKASVSSEVVSRLSYEEVNGVEYGHTKPTGERVLPRPFIRPAMAAMEPVIGAMLAERLGG